MISFMFKALMVLTFGVISKQESMLHYGMLLRAFLVTQILLFVENDYLNEAEEMMKDPLLA